MMEPNIMNLNFDINKILLQNNGYKKNEIPFDLLKSVLNSRMKVKSNGNDYCHRISTFSTPCGSLIQKIEANDYSITSVKNNDFNSISIIFLISGAITGKINNREINTITAKKDFNLCITDKCDYELNYHNAVYFQITYDFVKNNIKINNSDIQKNLSHIMNEYFIINEKILQFCFDEYGVTHLLRLLIKNNPDDIKLTKNFSWPAMFETIAIRGNLKNFAHILKISISTASRETISGVRLSQFFNYEN